MEQGIGTSRDAEVLGLGAAGPVHITENVITVGCGFHIRKSFRQAVGHFKEASFRVHLNGYGYIMMRVAALSLEGIQCPDFRKRS